MPDADAGGSEEDEAAADAEGYGFGAGGGAEFAEDGGYVELGGVVGDAETGGDLLIGEAGGEHLEDFALAAGQGLGEFSEGPPGWRGYGERGLHLRRMENDEAGGHGLQRGG